MKEDELREIFRAYIKRTRERLDDAEENGMHNDMLYWAAYSDGVLGLVDKIEQKLEEKKGV